MSGSRQAHPEAELSPGLHGRASAAPGITYRLLRVTWRLAAATLRLRLEVEGREHLPIGPDGRPAGRWIAAVMPHRTWIDPFIPWLALPSRPRLAFFGDARAMARSPLRRFILARLGGVIPIPAGHDPATVALHFVAAQQALDAGMVFCLMPETGPASEPGHLRRLGSGIGYIALRNRAQIVSLIVGGNEELYLGRKVILRILPPMDPIELAGLGGTKDGAAAPAGSLPEPGSQGEREAVHRLLATLAEGVGPTVADVHARSQPPSGMPRRGRFLTKLFR